MILKSTFKGWLLVSLLFAAVAVDAQTARREDNGVARLQSMINQMTAEKAALERRNAELESEVRDAEAASEQLRRDKERLENRVQALEGSVNQYQESNQRANDVVDETRERMNELVARFRENVDLLRQTEGEKNELSGELASSRSSYMECARANVSMYEVGINALTALEDRGVLKRLSRSEPFTQLGRVRLENLVDEYRTVMDDNRIEVEIQEPGS